MARRKLLRAPAVVLNTALCDRYTDDQAAIVHDRRLIVSKR
jgi:hypothetical protein